MSISGKSLPLFFHCFMAQQMVYDVGNVPEAISTSKRSQQARDVILPSSTLSLTNHHEIPNYIVDRE